MISLAKLARICAASLMLASLASCSPVRWLLVNSNGIATYNRNTGQFEILWEYQRAKADQPSEKAKPDTTLAPADTIALVPVR